MTNETWNAVDRYFTDLLVQADPALDAAMEASEAAGLPGISVSPCMGKLLHLLTRMHRVRTILEIGTLGGYSTIWMARALPADGRLLTLEADPKHAEIARSNIARAGVSHLVDVRLGPAIETLPRLEGRRRVAVRHDLHRCGQAEHAGVFRVGAPALPSRQSHHRGQCGPERRDCGSDQPRCQRAGHAPFRGDAGV